MMTMGRISSSIDGILGYLELISEIGEKAAGTPEELEAARLIEREFGEIGLENPRLEPFPVVCRRYGECQLEMVEPSARAIPCVNGGTSVSTPEEGIEAELVDAGFGTLRGYEALKRAGVDPRGKIALIERSDRLTYWPDIACRLASRLGVLAVINTHFVSEHTAFRKEAFPLAPIPVVAIPYTEAQRLRGALRRDRVKVRLKNLVETERGVSYNVIGDLTGSDYPEEVVTLTAHHDSWFEGANDDASGVALLLETAKLLREKARPRRTLRFISFGAEESGSDDFFEWSVGSFRYVKELGGETGDIVVNINLDVPAFGDRVVARATPEMTTYVQGIVRELDLENLFRVLGEATSATDHWSFVMAGVPSVNLGSDWIGYGKIYHTNYDLPITVSNLLLPHVLRVLLALMEGLGSADVLPYDFLPTIDRLERDLTQREARLKGILDVSRALEEAGRFKDLAEGHRRQRSSTGSAGDAAAVNRLQREICSRLNRCMIGAGGETNKEASWIVPEHLDMLVKVRDAVEALRRRDLRGAVAALSTLKTMAWGMNVDLGTYDETFELMLTRNRYPGLYINVMSELLSLRDKLRDEDPGVSDELSSIEEKYEGILGEVRMEISRLEAAVRKSAEKLMQIALTD